MHAQGNCGGWSACALGRAPVPHLTAPKDWTSAPDSLQRPRRRTPPQARAVIDGLPADMVALALPLDIQKISDAGLIRRDWRRAYPNNATGERVS